MYYYYDIKLENEKICLKKKSEQTLTTEKNLRRQYCLQKSRHFKI